MTMLMDISSHCCNQANVQPISNRRALSPGVLAALERVHVSLRKALQSTPRVSTSSLQAMAERLAEDGLLVTLRSGLGVGIESPAYLSTLRHSFLICQEGSSGLCVIVDPFFRDQFKVAGMPASSSYCAAVLNLPECFVGTIGTVNALVCLLTGTLFQESAALGMELPPWRSKQALISKWLPRRFADTVFAPPSLVTLHPALRSSVHGEGTPSTSPNSVQSWPTLTPASSDVASSNESSSDTCCISGTTSTSAVCRRSIYRPPSEPYAVIAGFTTTCAAAAGAPSRSCEATAAAASASTTTIITAATTITTPKPNSPTVRPSAARSALTEQLASAASFSRTIQAEAEAHWQRYFLNVEEEPTPAPPPPLPQQQQQAPSSCATAAAAVASSRKMATTDVSFSCSSLKASMTLGGRDDGLSTHEDVVRSLVVSPIHRRSASGSLKRGCGSTYNLKLPSSTLKMLPKVYTVKLASAVDC